MCHQVMIKTVAEPACLLNLKRGSSPWMARIRSLKRKTYYSWKNFKMKSPLFGKFRMLPNLSRL